MFLSESLRVVGWGGVGGGRFVYFYVLYFLFVVVEGNNSFFFIFFFFFFFPLFYRTCIFILMEYGKLCFNE